MKINGLVDEQNILKPQKTLVNNNGYFSHTTNTFQIGVVHEKEWAGDEVVIYRDQSFPFSIVAQTQVEALEISTTDLFGKVSKDMVQAMEANA